MMEFIQFAFRDNNAGVCSLIVLGMAGGFIIEVLRIILNKPEPRIERSPEEIEAGKEFDRAWENRP